MAFTLTEDHIKLISKFTWVWDDCEFGAPAIDSKRPYGNSHVYGDIAEILGINPEDGDYFSQEQEDFMWKIYSETDTALEVILKSRSFELGEYERDYENDVWKKV